MRPGAAWIESFLAQERLPASFRQLIHDVHVPIARRIAAAARQNAGLLQVGLCGSQGSGKSTLAAVLSALLEADGLATAVLSIDDLYLTHAQRQTLAATVHPLLATRGVPGTHDVALGLATFAALARPGEVPLPSFDKQVDDRRARDQWPATQAPVRVAILEGWCVGASAQSPAQLAVPVNALERDEDADGRWRRYVNDALQGDYTRLFGDFGLLVLLQAPSFDVVYDWRLEQERKLRTRVAQSGGDASRVMNDAQVARFISHYERLTRHILEEMPARADVILELDAARAPLRLTGGG